MHNPLLSSHNPSTHTQARTDMHTQTHTKIIHPSSTPAVSLLGNTGGNPATVEQRWGAHRTGHPSDAGPHTHRHTYRGNLKTPIDLQSIFFGLWEEAGVPGENPRMQRGNM